MATTTEIHLMGIVGALAEALAEGRITQEQYDHIIAEARKEIRDYQEEGTRS